MNENKKIKIMKYLGIVFSMVVIFSILIHHYSIHSSFIINDSTYDTIRKVKFGLTEDNLVEKSIYSKSGHVLGLFTEKLEYNITDHEKLIFIAIIVVFAIVLFLIYLLTSKNYIVLFILPLSPFFLNIFTEFSDISLAVMFLLASLFFMKTGKYMHVIGLIMFSITAYLNFYLGVFGWIMLLFLEQRKVQNKMQNSRFYVIKLAAYIIPLIFFFDISKINSYFFQKTALERIFVEFGAYNGIAIATFIMMCIGLYMFRDENRIINVAFVAAIVISFVHLITGLIIINGIAVYLASKLIIRMIEERWESSVLKQISVILIFCVIVFSGVSFMHEVGSKKSEADLIDGLLWLKDNSASDAAAFTHHKYGYKVKFFAERPILLDTDLALIKNSREKYDDSTEIFNSRNLEKTSSLLEKYRIKFIIITDEMKQGLVWNKNEEGLVFVLENNPQFEKVYENSNVDIYEFSISS